MADLVDAADDRARIGRENLAYAVKQNLRQESRRRAQERTETWADPYPDLQAPTEHTGIVLTRGVKVGVGIGVLAGIAAVVGLVLASVLVDNGPKTMALCDSTTTRGAAVTLRACADGYCPSREVGPGDETETKLDADKLVQVFRLDLPGTDKCLPLRVHDAYQLFGQARRPQATLSQATSCPGTTVLPRPGGSKTSPRLRRRARRSSQQAVGERRSARRRASPRARPVAVGQHLDQRLANRVRRSATGRLAASEGSKALELLCARHARSPRAGPPPALPRPRGRQCRRARPTALRGAAPSGTARRRRATAPSDRAPRQARDRPRLDPG